MLVNSIENPQFLDFILSDTDQLTSGPDYYFEKGEWRLTWEKDEKFVAFTWLIKISKSFNRNSGNA